MTNFRTIVSLPYLLPVIFYSYGLSKSTKDKVNYFLPVSKADQRLCLSSKTNSKFHIDWYFKLARDLKIKILQGNFCVYWIFLIYSGKLSPSLEKSKISQFLWKSLSISQENKQLIYQKHAFLDNVLPSKWNIKTQLFPAITDLAH